MPSVPSVPRMSVPPQTRLEELAFRIEIVRDMAQEDGFGTLAHILECALLEVNGQIAQVEHDIAAAAPDQRTLWRPLSG